MKPMRARLVGRTTTTTRHYLFRRHVCTAAEASTSIPSDDYARRQLECIARLADDRPAKLRFDSINGRHMLDNVASADECRRAVASAKRAMLIACDTDGAGRLFPPDIDEAQPLLGTDGSALFAALQERVHESVREHYGDYRPVNSLLSWIDGADGDVDGDVEAKEEARGVYRSYDWRVDATDGTYAPHVDKANQRAYDLSALLYLTTSGVDFTGGLFAFNDPDMDRLVEPKAGRLLAFTSGFENLHQVRRVRTGERLVLSVWFAAA